MANKFLIIQSFAYDHSAESYTGRPTQINAGAANEDWQKKFLEIMRNCKPVDGNRFHCGFDVYYDDEIAFEVRSNRMRPAFEWHPAQCLNKAGKDEIVIVMRTGILAETDCPVSRSHDCPLCIASGKCPSPFIRKYIGKVFFSDQYGKRR